jgi:hypothetical protein
VTGITKSDPLEEVKAGILACIRQLQEGPVMPTLAHVPHGKVTALWGTAFVRSPNGKMRLLKLGDLVNLGDVILTSQDGIVQISGEDGEPRDPRLALAQPDGAEPKAALVPDEIEQVIQALNNNDPGVAPAAKAASCPPACGSTGSSRS